MWLFGSLMLTWELLVGRARRTRTAGANAEATLRSVAIRSGLPLSTLRRLDAFKRPPVTTRVFKMMRELWIDRAIMAALMIGGTIALALVPIPLWIKLMVPLCAFPLSYLIYEGLVADDGIFAMEKEAKAHARRIARLLPVRVVTFGHSHVPEQLPVLPGVWYVNTGTWAPVMKPEQDQLLPGLRNALQVVIDGDDVRVRLETHQTVRAPVVAPTSESAAPQPVVEGLGAPRRARLRQERRRWPVTMPSVCAGHLPRGAPGAAALAPAGHLHQHSLMQNTPLDPLRMVGLALRAMGLLLAVTPDLLGPARPGPDLFETIERRIPGGGFFGLGLFLLARRPSRHWPTRIATIALWATVGLLAARLLGLVLDGMGSGRQWMWVGVEAVVVAAAAFYLKRRGALTAPALMP